MSTHISHNIHSDDVPLPIVSFGRWVYVVALSVAILAQQPLITTAILLIVLPSVFFGPRFNLISTLGKKLFAKKLPGAEREDYRLIRFNNAIALSLLIAAQVAFFLGAAFTGWIFIGVIIVASAAALAGFCLGCVLYYRFKLYHYKFLGEHE